MIAADRPRLDQPHVEVGALFRQRKRGEPAGEPAADNRDIAEICVARRHRTALAAPARRRKAIATPRRAASLAR